MENVNYNNILKTKKIELINSLDLLGKNVTTKIKAKNKIIENLDNKFKNTDLEYIAKYKNEKNTEFNLLKTELNDILNNIDTIINNITK